MYETYAELKSKFLAMFANLPVGLRREIIYISKEHGPMTYNVLYLEVKQDTELAKIALDELEQMDLI